MFSRISRLLAISAAVLFAPLAAACADDGEIGAAREAMEAEFDRIESDIKDAERKRESGVSGFAAMVFDSNFGLGSYLKVMEMLRRNRASEGVARIAQEVRMIYSETGYGGVSSDAVMASLGAKDGVMENPYGGIYAVGPADGGKFFCVQANGLKPDDCDYVAGSDWPGTYVPGSGARGKAVIARGDFASWRAPKSAGKCSRDKDAAHTVYFCYK
jgi:hypothetical protein